MIILIFLGASAPPAHPRGRLCSRCILKTDIERILTFQVIHDTFDKQSYYNYFVTGYMFCF